MPGTTRTSVAACVLSWTPSLAAPPAAAAGELGSPSDGAAGSVAPAAAAELATEPPGAAGTARSASARAEPLVWRSRASAADPSVVAAPGDDEGDLAGIPTGAAAGAADSAEPAGRPGAVGPLRAGAVASSLEVPGFRARPEGEPDGRGPVSGSAEDRRSVADSGARSGRIPLVAVGSAGQADGDSASALAARPIPSRCASRVGSSAGSGSSLDGYGSAQGSVLAGLRPGGSAVPARSAWCGSAPCCLRVVRPAARPGRSGGAAATPGQAAGADSGPAQSAETGSRSRPGPPGAAFRRPRAAC